MRGRSTSPQPQCECPLGNPGEETFSALVPRLASWQLRFDRSGVEPPISVPRGTRFVGGYCYLRLPVDWPLPPASLSIDQRRAAHSVGLVELLIRLVQQRFSLRQPLCVGHPP